MNITDSQVIDALRPVQDPELRRSIVDLGMVREVAIDSPRVSILIALVAPGYPLTAEIERRVVEAVTALDGVEAVRVAFTF